MSTPKRSKLGRGLSSLERVMRAAKTPSPPPSGRRSMLAVSAEIGERVKDAASWRRLSIRAFVEGALRAEVERIEREESERQGEPFIIPPRPRS